MEKKIIRVFLCGDVMIGRGIDQILPHPCPPGLHEAYVSSALVYVTLAERVSGLIATPADCSYIWGAALDILSEKQPDLRIANLETSITLSEAYETKGINYRVSPRNAACLRSAGIDCCALANNHVLDWGAAGLVDTLNALEDMSIIAVGAGRNHDEARRAAIFDIPEKSRIVVVAYGLPTSGVPCNWAATNDRSGVNFLPDLSDGSIAHICEALEPIRKKGDVVIVSLHWGPNWGYEIREEQRRFAYALIDRGGVSIIHGHSSHHPKALEVYNNRLILYGAGDFLNDYEGIGGYEQFRADLTLMYFVDVDASTGKIEAVELAPLQIRRFRLERALPADIDWLARTMNLQCAPYSVNIARKPTGYLLGVV